MNAFGTAARLVQPESLPSRTLTCLRIAGFSSWVREQLDPAQPDVIIFSGNSIVCCSPSLRQQGLMPGDSLQHGRQLFPQAAFHPYDPHLDAATWEDVLHLLHTIAPNLTALRLGWALMIPHDLTGIEQLARSLRASVGIARSRMVAMLAALDATPGALRYIEPASGTSFLREVPVQHLLELDLPAELVAQLEREGIGTLGQLCTLSRNVMSARFGVNGIRLFDLLHLEASTWDIPLFEPPPSVAATAEIREGMELRVVYQQIIDRLVAELASRRAQLMTVSISGPRVVRPRVIRRVLATPASDSVYLTSVCRDLLERIISPDETMRSLTVELGGLLEEECAPSAELSPLHHAVQTIIRPLSGRQLAPLLG